MCGDGPEEGQNAVTAPLPHAMAFNYPADAECVWRDKRGKLLEAAYLDFRKNKERFGAFVY